MTFSTFDFFLTTIYKQPQRRLASFFLFLLSWQTLTFNHSPPFLCCVTSINMKTFSIVSVHERALKKTQNKTREYTYPYSYWTCKSVFVGAVDVHQNGSFAFNRGLLYKGVSAFQWVLFLWAVTDARQKGKTWNYSKCTAQKPHYFSTYSGGIHGGWFWKKWVSNQWRHVWNLRGGWTGRQGGAGLGGNKLLCVGGAAEHLANGLGDGVAVDAVDLEQLVRFATARNVGDSQAVQVEAGLVDHGWGHCLPEAACGNDRKGGGGGGGGEPSDWLILSLANNMI